MNSPDYPAGMSDSKVNHDLHVLDLAEADRRHDEGMEQREREREERELWMEEP